MNKLTALTWSGLALLCLLSVLSLPAQVNFCPPYPRSMDQAFFCITSDVHKLKLDQNASLHNPVRTPPKTLTFTNFIRRSHSGGGKTQHRRTRPQPSPLASRCGFLTQLIHFQDLFSS